MSTALKQTSAQVGSATNGITSLSGSLSIAQNFKAAIDFLTSHEGFQEFSHLIDQIPQLKKEIGAKENELKELKAQLKTQTEYHSTQQQNALSTYNKMYDKFKDENAALQNKIFQLQTEVRSKEGENTELKTARDDAIVKGKKLKVEHDTKTSRLKEREQEIGDLKIQLQKSKANAVEASKKLSNSQNRVAELEGLVKESTRQHEVLQNKFKDTDESLKELLSYSAPLHDINLQTMASELENLWNSATLFVTKYLRQDLPDHMLQQHWTKLHENTIFNHRIPLPTSNSDIAKDMRIATALGSLARLVNKHIFQPVYLLDGSDSSDRIRTVLNRQAVVETKKETFARGILMSMFPEEQEGEARHRIYSVVDDLTNKVGICDIIAPDIVGMFEKELESFLAQANGIWRSAQYSKQRLEPTFQYTHEVGYQWKIFEFQVADRKEGEQTVSPVNADHVEDEPYLIFPRVYSMASVVQPITAGTILTKAQLRSAAQEVHESTSNTPFIQPALGRRHTRPGRTMSMSVEGARGRTVETPFLSKAVVSVS